MSATKCGKHSQQSIKQLMVHKSWQYLHDNFHKFNERNKIKIALELCKKDIPQVMEGEIRYTAMSVIKIDNKAQELNIGEIPDNIRNKISGHQKI